MRNNREKYTNKSGNKPNTVKKEEFSAFLNHREKQTTNGSFQKIR